MTFGFSGLHKDLNYLSFQSFGFRCTWWMLFETPILYIDFSHYYGVLSPLNQWWKTLQSSRGLKCLVSFPACCQIGNWIRFWNKLKCNWKHNCLLCNSSPVEICYVNKTSVWITGVDPENTEGFINRCTNRYLKRQKERWL
jgi:hypothetical protein